MQTLARAQAELGAEVSVLCVDHAGAARSAPTEGVPAGRNARRPRFFRDDDGPVRVFRAACRRSLNRLDFCPGLGELLRGLEEDGTDLLHLHTPNPTMLLALTITRPAIPLVITHHSDIIRQRILKFALRPFERFVYGRAARVQTTSPVYRGGSSFLARYDGRLESLPLGLDLHPFAHPSPAAKAYADQLHGENRICHGATRGAPLWLAVGRLVYYKGLDIAIRALPRVPGNLLIVGAGPLESELKHLARRLGVAERVLWHGYLTRDQLAGAYHAATALWFPSNARSEAFGLVQVEAMAGGCPVINADIPHSGVPWVSRDGESGLTVAVNDPAALAAAARRMVEEPGLRAALSAGARRRAAGEFDHRVMARRSLTIYHQALRGEPATSFPPAEVAADEFSPSFDLAPVAALPGAREGGRETGPPSKHDPDGVPTERPPHAAARRPKAEPVAR